MPAIEKQKRISSSDWQPARAAYLDEVRPFVENRRFRRSRGLKHPLEDFLWEYYGLRGGHLLKWSPGPGVLLLDASEEEFPEKDGFQQVEDGRSVDVTAILSRRSSGLRWITNLLQTLQDRSPVFSCLGLHEWAMVYEAQDIRHEQLPLRLSHEQTREVVESFPLRCTHYDAFRFFSPSAQPLNATSLSSETRTEHEQPGCLHANMDLFKWCMKLQPLVPSQLTLHCFRLACEARVIDMRASPYDLTEFGEDPIRIETAAGRATYGKAQQAIADQARPLRAELLKVLQELEGISCKSDGG